MARFVAILLTAGLIVSIPAAAGSLDVGEAIDEPRARAWAVRISAGMEQVGATLLAEALAESGTEPVASAAPFALMGESPQRATATRDHREDVQTGWSWTDDTGSATIEGAYSEARVTAADSSARAGLGSVVGSGFALADEFFTWEEQEEFMELWTEVNDAVFSTLNEILIPLRPLAGAAGLDLPTLEGAPAVGFVDFATARQIAAGTRTSAGSGFSSASAEATIAELRMLAGFIEVRDVAAEALSESAAGVDERDASSTLGGLRIAGVRMSADEEGLRVAGNDLLSRSVVQPLMDVLLSQLEAAGIRIRVLEVREDGDLRQSTALEVEVALPSGMVSVSVGHASASAASVGAFAFPTEVPAETPATPAPPAPIPPAVAVAEEAAPEPTPSPALTPTPTVDDEEALEALHDYRARPQPAAVARSLRTVFLVMGLGSVIGALLLPAMVGAGARTDRRRGRGGMP